MTRWSVHATAVPAFSDEKLRFLGGPVKSGSRRQVMLGQWLRVRPHPFASDSGGGPVTAADAACLRGIVKRRWYNELPRCHRIVSGRRSPTVLACDASLPPFDDQRRHLAGARNSSKWNRARSVPARLPGHLRHAGDGRKWPGGARGRRSRAPFHAGISLRQGESLRGAHVSRGSTHDADAPRRSEGHRPVPSGELGRGARRDRHAARRHRAFGRWRAGNPSVFLRRHHGHGPGRSDGPSLLPPARRVKAGSHDLLDGRHRRHAHDGGREHRCRQRRRPRE